MININFIIINQIDSVYGKVIHTLTQQRHIHTHPHIQTCKHFSNFGPMGQDNP